MVEERSENSNNQNSGTLSIIPLSEYRALMVSDSSTPNEKIICKEILYILIHFLCDYTIWTQGMLTKFRMNNLLPSSGMKCVE
jgi:hypothetical protein